MRFQSNHPVFRIAFSESFADMPRSGEFGYLMPRPHTFNVVKSSPPPKLDGKARYTSDFVRVVPEDGRLSFVFKTLRGWLKECLAEHPECRNLDSAGQELLPIRVIDVNDSDTDVRLYIPELGQRAPYAALSHCWGGNIPNKTLKASLAGRQEILPLDELPRSFQDAIRITRELRIRFVWIDALCIAQDDADDWRKEAQKMTDVYAQATVNISSLNSRAARRAF